MDCLFENWGSFFLVSSLDNTLVLAPTRLVSLIIFNKTEGEEKEPISKGPQSWKGVRR